jgi:hypothetical protein
MSLSPEDIRPVRVIAVRHKQRVFEVHLFADGVVLVYDVRRRLHCVYGGVWRSRAGHRVLVQSIGEIDSALFMSIESSLRRTEA